MGNEYPKINSIFKRDDRGKFIDGEFSCPEFEFLQDVPWEWTEKVDGTNVRVTVDLTTGGVTYRGRTDNAQMPVTLMEKLRSIFEAPGLGKKFLEVFPETTEVTLYGEGYGAKIQKGGGKYIADGCDFILFDVLVGEWWLRRADVNDVAEKLGLRAVPTFSAFKLTLNEAEALVRLGGVASAWDGVEAEGLVGRPAVDLWNRRGERITVKIKGKDFQ